MQISWQIEEDLVFLIKTMKKEHLESTLKEGKFCFNYPQVFNGLSQKLQPGQFDKWDSHWIGEVHDVMVAPIISKEDEPIRYGKPVKILDKGTMHSITGISKMTPLCSFRKVDNDDLRYVDDCFFYSLGDIVDRIITEFGHDAYILIVHPITFIDRILEREPCFAKSIHYGDLDQEHWDFLDNAGFEQSEMFQKDVSYAWQKEYRIILRARQSSGRQFIELGSIEDIAIGGDIEDLRNGFVFADSKEAILSLKGIQKNTSPFALED